MNELTHIDLFSGIGGFSLAAQSCGFKTILFCEIDEFCQKVLQERFGAIAESVSSISGRGASSQFSNERREEGQNWGEGIQPKNRKARSSNTESSNPILIPDIRDIDGTEWRGATLLTGGFPCQPFSQAGQRRGKEDDRYLWPEMLRVISEAKPSWIVGENVAGIIRMELDNVCSDLEGEGYEVQPVIIPACAKNAPHRRDRVWIIANSKGSRCEWRRSVKMGKRGKMANGAERKNSIDPNSIGKHDDNSRYGASKNGREFKKADNVSKGLWDIPWLEVATRFCRVDDGLPSWVYSDRVKRLKALGNAIVSQVAKEIIEGIYKIEKEI